MRQSFEEDLDPKQIRLTPEQAKAILARHTLEQPEAPASPTLADMAEALGISEPEALNLWQGVKQPPRAQPVQRKITLTPLLTLLLLVLTAVVVLVTWSSLAARGNPEKYQPPIAAQNIWERSGLPDGFSVAMSHDHGGIEYPPAHPAPVEELAAQNQIDLRNRVERAVPVMIEEELTNRPTLEKPVVTVTVATEAGKATFKVRALPSAFPLKNANASAAKLYDDVNRELAKAWDKLIPPSLVKKQPQR